MSTEKIPNPTNLKSNSKSKSSCTHTSNFMTNTSKSIENSYLPKMRTDYSPSDKSVESATGVDFPVNMPNPAVDPIVTNNISTWEFDYTEK